MAISSSWEQLPRNSPVLAGTLTTGKPRRLPGPRSIVIGGRSNRSHRRILFGQRLPLLKQHEKVGGWCRSEHPNRDAQFAYLNGQVKAFRRWGDPTICVDTKQKELVGAFKNAGGGPRRGDA
jgi:Rhodopirellula transposase DDE domain